MYCLWRMSQLKEELRKRGASLKGKKSDLVERLEAYDRNFNFENNPIDSPEPQMELPEAVLFKDVNGNTTLPPLTKEHIHWYFSRFDKKTDDGWRLYESRYLIALRAAQVGEYTFIKGICKASMKKVYYEVHCKIEDNGTIGETMCECAVGSGKEAHCKHVAVILFATEDVRRRKTFIRHIVCTQMLQTFHHPRKVFTASPLKAEKLPSKLKKEKIIFHPYPLTSVENYNTYIRNIVVGAKNSTMPLKQLYEPANPFAIKNDHGYTIDSTEEILLKELGLKNVSNEKIKTIELHTRGQTTNPEWHKERKNRITASNFHTACHLKPQNQNTYAVQLLNKQKISSRATTHGIINEPVAIQTYCDKYDLNVRPCGLFVSKENPFLGASPDGLLGDETIVEVKCPYAIRYKEINENTVPYLSKENGQLQLKKTCIYYYQIQGQLYCTQKKYCNLIVYTYKDMKVIFINRDETFITQMIQKLTDFYENYFKGALFNKYIYRNYK